MAGTARLRSSILAGAGALALALLGAAPASAHSDLVSTEPAAGAALEAPPTAVELVMSEPPQALGTQVSVTGPDGAELASGEPRLVDTTVSQPLVADPPAGEYRVTYRVTSADGHPVSGELAFTVSPASAAVPSADLAAEPTPEPSMTTQGTGEDPAAEDPAAQPAGEEASGGSPLDGRTGAALLALVAAGAVVALVVLQRRRQPPQD